MALHGLIQVNSTEVGYWFAERRVTAEDGINTYACAVEWTPENETVTMNSLGPDIHSRREEFLIFHDYREGAVALAAKVLVEASLLEAGAGIEPA